MTIIVLSGGAIFLKHASLVRYEQWRFVKSNVSERERFRVHEFFVGQVNDACTSEEVGVLLQPLFRWLSFRELDHHLGDDILNLAIECHRTKVNAFTVPALINALRTEDPDLRLRVHTALESIRILDYLSSTGPIPDEQTKALQAWTPSKEESAGEVKRRCNRTSSGGIG